MSVRGPDNPAPLVVAASLVAVEGMLLVAYAVLELASVSSDRVAVAVTTGVFFAAYGAVLLAAAWALTRRRSWARSPVALAQLIQLGLAWNFRDGGTLPLAIGLAVVAVAVLVGLFHPASMRALDR